ncbi:type II toxin-antitoxin system VapC family toxin [soil metagenome]
MTHALDANAVSIAFRKGDSGPARGILAHPRGSIAIPDVVRGEILFGALKGGSPRITNEIRAFLGLFPAVPFDHRCVEVYAEARAELERTGQRIGALDLMIAATALAHNLILVTHNTREFVRVPGLRIEDWQ